MLALSARVLVLLVACAPAGAVPRMPAQSQLSTATSDGASTTSTTSRASLGAWWKARMDRVKLVDGEPWVDCPHEIGTPGVDDVDDRIDVDDTPARPVPAEALTVASSMGSVAIRASVRFSLYRYAFRSIEWKLLRWVKSQLICHALRGGSQKPPVRMRSRDRTTWSRDTPGMKLTKSQRHL